MALTSTHFRTATQLRHSYSLVLAPGGVVYAGTAAGVRAARALALTTSGYAIAGTVADLRATRQLVTTTTAYPWTGSAAGLFKRVSLAAATGTFPWSGANAALLAARGVVASPGAVAWTGAAARLGRSISLTHSSTAFPWIGVAATFTTFIPTAERRIYRLLPYVRHQALSTRLRVATLDATAPAAQIRSVACRVASRRLSLLPESRRISVTSSALIQEAEGTMNAMPPKAPGEKLDYVFDWSAVLTTGEMITQSTWVVGSVLTQATPSPSFTNTTTTIWLSGGVDKCYCIVTNTITTSLGRIFSRSMSITVDAGA